AAPQTGRNRLVVLLGISFCLKDNESWQIIVHAGEAVCQPGAETRLARIHISRIHEHDGWLMFDGISVGRFNQGEIVHHARRIRKQIADPGSSLPMLTEGPMCGSNRETSLTGGHPG